MIATMDPHARARAADIKSFTSMCNGTNPALVMVFLNELFTLFDELVEKHSVYKVETIGTWQQALGQTGASARAQRGAAHTPWLPTTAVPLFCHAVRAGDCYMVAGGLTRRDADGVNTVTTQEDPEHANKVRCCVLLPA